MAFGFFVGTACHFMSLFTSVTLIFRIYGIKLLVIFSYTFVLDLDLVDRLGLGSVNSFLGNLHRVFGLNSDLDHTGKIQLCVPDLEKSL